MNNDSKKLLLVGDNPFHGISHLSQARARARGLDSKNAENAAGLVLKSFENGANGFMFSVSETTLSALKIMAEKIEDCSPELYAIVPYAYEYVRLATHLGTLGLGKKIAREVALSGNIEAVFSGLRGVAGMNIEAITKSYLLYEVSRIKSSLGSLENLKSLLLHEVITEMTLALDLDWFFHSYIRMVSRMGLIPGFETRNFAFLVKKFRDWNIDFSKILIVAPFNEIGFQMNPSKTECEQALSEVGDSHVIAMSILASGRLTVSEAANYLKSLPNIAGAVVGVSKEKHARETFTLLQKLWQDTPSS